MGQTLRVGYRLDEAQAQRRVVTGGLADDIDQFGECGDEPAATTAH